MGTCEQPIGLGEAVIQRYLWIPILARPKDPDLRFSADYAEALLTADSYDCIHTACIPGCLHDRVDCRAPFDGALLKCQALASLGAPPVDHGPAAFGRHAFTKAIGSDSLDLARLIRSFHFFFPYGSRLLGYGSAPLILEKFRRLTCCGGLFKPQPYLQAPKFVNN